jgi:hypothetical protein
LAYELTLKNGRDSRIITKVVEDTPERAIEAMKESGGYELILKDTASNCTLNRTKGNSRDAVIIQMVDYLNFKFSPVHVRVGSIHIGRR